MQRKLAAILSADVVGYSSLMEADEAGTLEQLKANRAEIFDPAVAAHGGRIFKLMGDGALVEFPSAVAAVNCALAVQKGTEDAPKNDRDRTIRYRIGVNLGEVIVDGEDIYGEGVNVAARLQALALVGGVALSGIVRDQVDGKAPCLFEDQGEHTVKNIERPVHVFFARPAEPDVDEDNSVDAPNRLSICVLPFANMSGDAEQEYFSDGISEDIITDLSKVSALHVISRNTAFGFKGKNVDVRQVARQLKVSHILEGSVRKAGGRVRITAQLIDGTSDGHVWAERYDRDLNDIFALQDEISEAIVNALKLKLMPEEKKAIEQRGTSNIEAYNLFLMARQYNVSGNIGDSRRIEATIRLCKRATEIDPNYAHAWALMAVSQVNLRWYGGSQGEDGLATAERAIELDPKLAEAHAAKAVVLTHKDQLAAAKVEIETALRLDPDSYEVNRAAGRLAYAARQIPDAIQYFEKAAALMETDYWSAGMLAACYKATGDAEGVRRAAQRVVERTEKIVAQDPNNGSAMGFLASSLAALGQAARAKDVIARAILLDPDNGNMRYNLACGLIVDLHDAEAGLDLLEPLFERLSTELITWAKSDPDMDSVRDHPRFKAMMANAEARLAGGQARAQT
ncbi:MAG: TPR end-of-group domain-containing protein [Alphaproteobacteria bacterium]